MKRDNDYLRKLLFKIESSDNYLIFVPLTFGMSDEQHKEYYHVQLLCDAGYLVKLNETKNSGYRLTSQGHDFIEAIRDKGIWEKTKDAVAETGGNATMDILKTLAQGLLRKKVAEHTGIEL